MNKSFLVFTIIFFIGMNTYTLEAMEEKIKQPNPPPHKDNSQKPQEQSKDESEKAILLFNLNHVCYDH